MALKSNQELLVSTHHKILTLRKSDNSKGIKNEAEEVENALALYVRYVRLTNAFKRCYDTVVQPQKRIIVEKILECLIGRVLELKQEIINLDKRSFRFVDNLSVFKMNPSDLQLLVPLWPKTEIEMERYQIYQELLSECPTPVVTIETESPTVRDCDQAVILIQRMERARQVRLRIVNKMLAMNFYPEKSDWKDKRSSSATEKRVEEILKAKQEMEELKLKELAELQCLGMEPYTNKPKNVHLRELEERQEQTRKLQAEKMKDYIEALATIKEEIYNSEDTMRFTEGLEDEIREWYLDFREKTEGEFPIFPSVEEGGSLAIYNAELQQEFLKTKGKAAKEKKKGIHRRRHKIRKQKKVKIKRKTAKEEREQERLDYLKSISEFGPALDSACKSFERWKNHNESKLKVGISHDEGIIRKDKEQEVRNEVRLNIDEEMRKELDILREARDKDMKRAPRGKKKDKKKRKRKRKKKKRKKAKDFETVCKSLINDGIIVNYPKIYFKDILGEYNVAGFKQQEGQFIPFLADLKILLNELCTLPLCSELIHSKAPYIRSVALVGPPGVSKKSLLYAVCTESQAALLDFSMSNVMRNYPGRAGVRVLMKTIKLFASLMQPLVLAIHDTEEMFKTKGGFSRVEKRSMRNSVKRFIKGLKRSDRVLVFGISDKPYLAKASKFSTIYRKIFYLRLPEYGSRKSLWKEVIAKCGAKLSFDFPLSVLSFLSDGYNKKEMTGMCKKILTPRRVSYIDTFPLEIKEFLPFFSEYTPLYRKEAEAFETWISKIPARCR